MGLLNTKPANALRPISKVSRVPANGANLFTGNRPSTLIDLPWGQGLEVPLEMQNVIAHAEGTQIVVSRAPST